MNMSLPIEIFSNDSILQRGSKALSYAPIYVAKAAETIDPFEQFRLVIAFYFSMLHFGIE